jgi:hypothetical protein
MYNLSTKEVSMEKTQILTMRGTRKAREALCVIAAYRRVSAVQALEAVLLEAQEQVETQRAEEKRLGAPPRTNGTGA